MKNNKLIYILIICLSFFMLTSCANKMMKYQKYIDNSNKDIKEIVCVSTLNDGETIVSRITQTKTEEAKDDGYHIITELKTESLNNYFELEEIKTYDEVVNETKSLGIPFIFDKTLFSNYVFKNNGLNTITFSQDNIKEFLCDNSLSVKGEAICTFAFDNNRISTMSITFKTLNGFDCKIDFTFKY